MILARNLLDTLRRQNIESTARRIGTETGLTYRPAADGKAVSGVYRRSVLLTSGRFAMLDDATGFSLVPWRPVLEHRVHQSMTAVTRAASRPPSLDESEDSRCEPREQLEYVPSIAQGALAFADFTRRPLRCAARPGRK